MRSPALVGTVLLTLAPLIGTAHGQSRASSPPATRPDVAAVGEQHGLSTRVDLDIGATSVPDYIEYLHGLTGLNIVLLNEKGVDPSKLMLPALKLKQMDATTAIMLLQQMPGGHIEVTPQNDNTFFVTVHAPPIVVGSGGAFYESGEPVQKLETRIFPLERIFLGEHPAITDADQRKAEVLKRVPDALQLIEQALTIGSESSQSQAAIKLHQSTNTLIIRGTADQLATAEQALKALTLPQEDAETVRARSREQATWNFDAKVSPPPATSQPASHTPPAADTMTER